MIKYRRAMFIRQRAMSRGRENLTEIAEGINRIARVPDCSGPAQSRKHQIRDRICGLQCVSSAPIIIARRTEDKTWAKIEIICRVADVTRPISLML